MNYWLIRVIKGYIGLLEHRLKMWKTLLDIFGIINGKRNKP